MVNKIQKQLRVKKDKQIIQQESDEELLKEVRRINWTNCEPKNIIDDYRQIINENTGKSNNEIAKAEGKFREVANKIIKLVELDKHYLAAESVGTRYRPLAVQFINSLIEEYDCKLDSEKALAQTVGIAYVRILEYSSFLNGCTSIDYISNEKNSYYSLLSKELDRANRHFLTSLTTLKQIKSPSLKVNLKAKNAFVSQNQQVNTINNKKDEIIKPK